MDTIPLAIPKAGPEPLPELAEFVAPLAPLFQRSQSRESLERYVTGLLTDLPHKNCQTIAAAVANTSTERLQHLLTDADWDAQAMDELRVRRLTAHSPAGGALVLDDTGLPKQGKRSVGVARQYSGTLGKIGNCQVLVSAEYVTPPLNASQSAHWPVAGRLYLPERWTQDPERRREARIPDEVTFQTKPELALTLIDQARHWEVPFTVVVTDAGYGDNPNFLAGLEARQLAYVCGVESNFGVRLPAEIEQAAAQPRPTRGRPRLPRPAPLHTAAELTASLPESAWRTVIWREGRKGHLRKQFAALRVHWATGSPEVGAGRSIQHGRVRTGPEGWLLAERPLPGQDDKPKWYLSNLPPETPLRRLAELAHCRWSIEQLYEEAKGECGLDDYQGRLWDGFHRHVALVMLTYSFLAQQRLAAPAAGTFPPRATTEPPGTPPQGAHCPPPGPRPMVGDLRLDRELSPTSQLTRQY